MTNQERAKKTFDCLEYKREVQRRIFEDIRDLSDEERIQYFRRRAEEGLLGAWWRKVKAASNQSRA